MFCFIVEKQWGRTAFERNDAHIQPAACRHAVLFAVSMGVSAFAHRGMSYAVCAVCGIVHGCADCDHRRILEGLVGRVFED